MSILRKAWIRIMRYVYGGEAWLELRCGACGYMVTRRLTGGELEEWLEISGREKHERCLECGTQTVSPRLLREKEFRKKYPFYMQGG